MTFWTTTRGFVPICAVTHILLADHSLRVDKIRAADAVGLSLLAGAHSDEDAPGGNMDDVSAGEATRHGAHARRGACASRHGPPRSSRHLSPTATRPPSGSSAPSFCRSRSRRRTTCRASPSPTTTTTRDAAEPGVIDKLETFTFAVAAVGVPDPVPFVRPRPARTSTSPASSAAPTCARRADPSAWATAGLAGLALVAYLLAGSIAGARRRHVPSPSSRSAPSPCGSG